MASAVKSSYIKTVLKRDWADLEPKILAFFSAGVSASVIIKFAEYFGVTLDPALAALIASALGLLAGYFKSGAVKQPLTVKSTDSIGLKAKADDTPVTQTTVTQIADAYGNPIEAQK